MTARTHHICFGAELGCSGANPCEHCREVLEKNVFFWASHQMVLRGLMTVEAARTLALLWEQGWRNLHGWMAQDVEIASRSLDLSRVLIAPEGNAPPAVANVSVPAAFPFFPPLPAEPPIAARPPVGLREVPFSFPVPPSQAPVPPPAPVVAAPAAAVASAPSVPAVAAPAAVAARPPRTEMSIEDVVALATPVEAEAAASPSDISDASLNGAAHVVTHEPSPSPASLKAES